MKNQFNIEVSDLIVFLLSLISCSDEKIENQIQSNLNEFEISGLTNKEFLNNLNLNVSKNNYSNSAEFSTDFNEYFKSDLDKYTKIASYTLYLNTDWGDDNFEKSDILGVSVHNVQNGIMYHDFYKKNEDGYKKEISILENKISYNSLWFILINKLGQKFQNLNKGIKVITDKTINYGDFANQRNAFPLLISEQVYSKVKPIVINNYKNQGFQSKSVPVFIDDGG